MDHGLSNSILYSVNRIETTFKDESGKKICFSGTSFFILNIKGKLCLVTNRHVIDIRYNDNISKYTNFKLSEVRINYKEYLTDSTLLSENRIMNVENLESFRFPNSYKNDVACLVTPIVCSNTGGKITINFFIDYHFLASEQKINDKLSVSDFVAFPGFPEWYDRKNKSAILRTGSIASDPRTNYSINEGDMGDVIAFEAFSFGGSSGSPVFAMQRGIKVGEGLDYSGYREVMLIGINAGHLGSQNPNLGHSGMSYFYKSSVIMDLIDL